MIEDVIIQTHMEDWSCFWSGSGCLSWFSLDKSTALVSIHLDVVETDLRDHGTDGWTMDHSMHQLDRSIERGAKLGRFQRILQSSTGLNEDSPVFGVPFSPTKEDLYSPVR